MLALRLLLLISCACAILRAANGYRYSYEERQLVTTFTIIVDPNNDTKATTSLDAHVVTDAPSSDASTTDWGRAPLQPEDYTSLSEVQDKVLSLLPIVPCILSTWGSVNIIHMVLTSQKWTPYRRILFGVSCCDLINSLAFSLQPFLIPQETSQRSWAIGNDATCTALGWFNQFHLSSMWYNGMLSFYFVLTIRFGIQERTLARTVEPFMHVLSIGYPFVTATIGAAVNMYHEVLIGHGCWVYEYPEGCQDCVEFPDTERPCCQGSYYGWIWGGLPTMMVFCLILVNNAIVYRHVRATLQASQKYLESIKRISQQATAQQCDRQAKRIQAVATQAFLYVGAFAIVYVPALALRIMESRNYNSEDEDKLFPILVFQSLTIPLLGFFNCLIFVRPSYMRVRKRHPKESRFWAFRRALHGERVQPSRRELNAKHSVDTPSTQNAELMRRSKNNPHRRSRQKGPEPIEEQKDGEASASLHASELLGLGDSINSSKPESAIHHHSAPERLLDLSNNHVHLFEDVLFEDNYPMVSFRGHVSSPMELSCQEHYDDDSSELEEESQIGHSSSPALLLDDESEKLATSRRTFIRRMHSTPNLNQSARTSKSIRKSAAAPSTRNSNIEDIRSEKEEDDSSDKNSDNIPSSPLPDDAPDPPPMAPAHQEDFNC